MLLQSKTIKKMKYSQDLFHRDLCFVCEKKAIKSHFLCLGCNLRRRKLRNNFKIIIIDQQIDFDLLMVNHSTFKEKFGINIGKEFQAVLPPYEPSSQDEKTIKNGSRIENDHECNFLQINVANMISEEELVDFKVKINNVLRQCQINSEKILYLLNIFQYDKNRCLNHLKVDPQNWTIFLENLKI